MSNQISCTKSSSWLTSSSSKQEHAQDIRRWRYPHVTLRCSRAARPGTTGQQKERRDGRGGGEDWQDDS